MYVSETGKKIDGTEVWLVVKRLGVSVKHASKRGVGGRRCLPLTRPGMGGFYT